MKLYKYNDLPSQEAKARAAEWFANNVMYDWQVDGLEDFMVQEAERLGISDGHTLRWSLGHQGEFVSAQGSLDFDAIRSVLKEDNDLAADATWVESLRLIEMYEKHDLSVRLDTRHHGGGSNSTHAEIEVAALDDIDVENCELEDFPEGMSSREIFAWINDSKTISETFEELVQDILSRLLKYGNDEVDYFHSDESAAGHLESDDYDYLFDEDGSHVDEDDVDEDEDEDEEDDDVDDSSERFESLAPAALAP